MVGPSKQMHHLINKPAPRTASRKGTPESHSDNISTFNNGMDAVYIYAAGPPPSDRPKMIKRRESRIRSSFFGGGQVKRESYELPSEETEGMRSPSRSMTSSSDDKENNMSFLSRRKLRKSSSHASLTSAAFAYETARQEKAGRKGFAELLRGGKTSPIRQTAGQRKPSHQISKPFDFFHITHGNSQQFSRMQQTDDCSLVRDWQNVVRDSALPSRQNTIKDGSPVVITPGSLQRTTSIHSRRRANSEKSISPQESMCDLSSPNSPTRSQDGSRYPFPPSPPPRTSSRHCLRSLAESPTEEDEEDECVFRPSRQSRLLHAITTQGDCSYGRKSPGVGKMMRGLSEDEDSSGAGSTPEDEFEESTVSELRSSKSTPDLLSLRHRRYLSTGRRPMSQLSAVSDTLNGTFAPPSPRLMPTRRMSRRVSAHMRAEGFCSTDSGAFLDSWEEDIDWCYGHGVDADCEFDWDRGSEHEAAYEDESTDQPTPLSESLTLNNEMVKFAGGRESFILVEKRITGVFEDKLLLPPSPQLTGFPDSTIGVADGGFDTYEPESEDIIFRAASTALRHRSISSAASLPELVPGRSYRDELNRVARQLDDHIAALNQEAYFLHPLTTDLPAPGPHSFFMGTRSRADSEATCVTLCSDTDTITPIDTNEIITPSSSAHNSLHFTRHDDGRAEKGLSFPAAALPGVIEFAPDGLHHIAAEEQEFLHFI